MFGVAMALSLAVLVADAEVTKTLSKEETELAKREYEKVVARRAERSPIEGTIVHYQEFPSEVIRVRPVNVWLPEGYDPASSDRYPVIYMHDGQMMFDHDTSPYSGMDVFWDVDKAITKLVRNGEIRPAIVVAVWMASWAKGARGAEFMPQKVVTDEVWQVMRDEGWGFAVEEGGQELSADNYLEFIVHELKPFIDENYRTESDRSNTLVMGSSMGGLISAYALRRVPRRVWRRGLLVDRLEVWGWCRCSMVGAQLAFGRNTQDLFRSRDRDLRCPLWTVSTENGRGDAAARVHIR